MLFSTNHMNCCFYNNINMQHYLRCAKLARRAGSVTIIN